MRNAKPIFTLSCPIIKFADENFEGFDDPTLYKQVVGSLQQLFITKPKIAFFVNQVVQYTHQPSKTYWQGVKQILTYLQVTIGYGLFLHKSSNFELVGYYDIDQGDNLDD